MSMMSTHCKCYQSMMSLCAERCVGDVAERRLNVKARHPLTDRPLPVFVITSRQYGEYNSVDLGELPVLSQSSQCLVQCCCN